ncbi:MAG TPA: transporter [Candidatus Ozemobacteraceae bacterium]|nr:transporter [Candidatus Ozemobacteraceae bacterium]
MSRNTAILALAACLLALPAGAQEYLQPETQSQLKRSGFSNSFISSVKRQPVDPYRRVADARPSLGQTDSLPPASAPADGIGSTGTGDGASLPPITTPASTDSGTAAASTSGSSDTGGSAVSETKTSKKAVKSTKSKKSSKKSGKSKKRSTAPIVSSSSDVMVTQAPAPIMPVAAPYANQPAPLPAINGGDQEIYSQEPLKLPPVSSLPEPSRTTLPPVSRDAMMTAPLGDAVSRVLACNTMGLTGLFTTTSADVSKEGSFKMGFHSSWFTLDRVYDRVLASGESGDLLEIPLFFNYAVTNDLEFALSMPVLNYTIKSRILWSKDFRESGTGDSKLSFKYRVFDNPQYQTRGAFGLSFKFPTGSDAKGLGTGKTDFEIYTAFSKNFERVIAHLNLGYIMTGDPNTQFYPDGLADIFYYNLGLEYPHTNNVTVMAEVNGQDWGSEGLRIDVTPGLRYTPTENFAFEVGVPVSVTNDQRYGYNYKLMFGVTTFFR